MNRDVIYFLGKNSSFFTAQVKFDNSSYKIQLLLALYSVWCDLEFPFLYIDTSLFKAALITLQKW